MAFERHNCSEKLDNGETEAELKNYLPQIREMIVSTVAGAVAHPYQHKCLGLFIHKDAHCSIEMILSKHLKTTTHVCKSLYELPAPSFVMDFHFILFIYASSDGLQILRELGISGRVEVLKFPISKH